jgi:hypothetical protein
LRKNGVVSYFNLWRFIGVFAFIGLALSSTGGGGEDMKIETIDSLVPSAAIHKGN